jgi:hypothetical protein
MRFDRLCHRVMRPARTDRIFKRPFL